jgi:rhodanese-related sulfurtransferase
MEWVACRHLFYNGAFLPTIWISVDFLLDNIWLILVALISGGALLWPVLNGRGVKVSVLRATQLINQSNALVLDVREPSAFAASHLRDAKNVPLKELSNRTGDLAKHKAKPVIAVCQTGSQSSRAAAQLRKAGFEQAYSLEGGINAWQAAGMPMAK